MIVTKDICDKYSDTEIVQYSLLDVNYFACIFEKYEPILMRYILSISMVNNEEAEDILQESFVKIWKNLNGFDPSLKLSSWLYRIVHNQTISYWRKKKSYGKDNVVSTEDYILIDDSEDHGKYGEATRDDSKLSVAIQELSIKYREILILRFFESMSYAEISDILKIPEGTVAIRINRAKKVLLKVLGNRKQM